MGIFPSFLSLYLVFTLFVGSMSNDINYDGFQLFRVTLTKDHFHLLKELKRSVKIDTWKDPTLTFIPSSSNINNSKLSTPTAIYETDLMVSKLDSMKVTNFLEINHLHYEVKMSDIGSVIKHQKEFSRHYQQQRKMKIGVDSIDWNDYYPPEEIYNWLDEIVTNNSDIASIQIIGQSTLGRDLKMVKVSLPGSIPDKPAILLDGAFHAREWISPAIVTYIINELLNNREVNQAVLEAVDLYIIPLVNIDGYAYSHTDDRMWRKTLADYNDTVNGCIGVDPNRNFDFHFGEEGTSDDKCSEIYTGPQAFSEPETASLRDIAMDKTKNWVSYLTIHSYSQLWLTPWSYTVDLPEDYDDLMTFAHIGADALEAVHGTKYVVGATTEIGGMTAGCSDDWAKGVAGIKYANTLETRDTGEYGFLLPPQQILPTAEETWAGIKAVCLYVSQLK